ncbi:hypothetical protein E2C01_000821 [Portunus trituberculatus]|uniref:Uncharacterized protein n=1 Tax=Portunus trituberculatus TaxID=210409 RepID=A0A5B7CHM4_PORTR|nr:hypothetical protein [Portunus trituberculatus]
MVEDMFELFDCEALIAQVEIRPGLYDFQLKEYSNKNIKGKLWPEMCEAGHHYIHTNKQARSPSVIIVSNHCHLASDNLLGVRESAGHGVWKQRWSDKWSKPQTKPDYHPNTFPDNIRRSRY